MKTIAVPSVHFEDRPEKCEIDTIIVHSMHNPNQPDRFALTACKQCLDEVELSVHFLIGVKGEVWQLVPEEKKAWHAGESKMPNDGRTGVNAFSIGIELVGSEDTDFSEDQYQALATLCSDISTRHPIKSIFGHSDIAPERKTDPWGFDWDRFKGLMDGKLGIDFPINKRLLT